MNTSPFYEEPSDQLVSLANLAKKDYPSEFSEGGNAVAAEEPTKASPETETLSDQPENLDPSPKEPTAPETPTADTSPEAPIVDKRDSQPLIDTPVAGDSLHMSADRQEEVFREAVEKEAESITSLLD